MRFVARRWLFICITGLALITLILRVLSVRQKTLELLPRWAGLPLPPLYSQHHENELRLPQHHWNKKIHEDEPKVLFVPGHTRGSGWGNVMQEILLNAYLAYKSNRAFVFYNYTWNDNPAEDYADYAGKPIPSRIPLSALVAGPLVGGAFPPGSAAPLAIAEQYYNTICEDRKVAIDPEAVSKKAGCWMVEPISKAWMEQLSTVSDQCVEVAKDKGPIYTWLTFGERHAMDEVWQDFAASPILTHFRWSALIEHAFDSNRHLIVPSAAQGPLLSDSSHMASVERYPELSGLLVLHIRRGDYEGHCDHLANWSSSFLAFNGLPALEQFDPPEGGSWGTNTEENIAIYRSRCFPNVKQIVARVQTVLRANAARGVREVYVMTNGAREWVAELKDALVATGHFTHVSTSRDLVLDHEQKYVAQAVDMLVGQRAQVFIGNGWSSLTGGIVVMRQANGFHPETTRFF